MLKYLKVNYDHHNKEPQTSDRVTLQIGEFGESNFLNLIS